MKLITWNCQGAFRKKAKHILQINPDILVVQECEHPDKLIFNSSDLVPSDLLWIGDNKHKGLGVFSYGDYKIQLLKEYNPQIKYVAPIYVSGGEFDFILIAIWANNPTDKEGQYVEQVWKAVNFYAELLKFENVLLIGDLNSNKIWDKPKRKGNHSAVVQKLADDNIHSFYHKHYNEKQGEEIISTFFLYRNRNKPYHLDYCFASETLLNKMLKFEVGAFEDWIPFSDHMPIIVKFSKGEITCAANPN